MKISHRHLLFLFVSLLALGLAVFSFIGCASVQEEPTTTTLMPTTTGSPTTTGASPTTTGGAATTTTTTTIATTTSSVTTSTTTTTTTTIAFGAAEDVNTTDDQGGFDLALGSAHVLYRLDGTNYYYATNSGGTWVNTTIESGDASGLALYAAIAVDHAGTVHVSYFHNDGSVSSLKYASKEAGSSSWTVSTVESPCAAERSDLAVDNSGGAHIVFSQYNGAAYDLRYAKQSGSAWEITTFETSASYNKFSLTLDSDGYPHVAFTDSSTAALKYARYNGSSWLTATVDSNPCGISSLALGDDNKPHFSYMKGSALCYATGEVGSWVTQTLTTGAYSTAGVDIAVDRADNNSAHISYSYDAVKGSAYLDYITNRSGSWVTYSLASPAEIEGREAPICVDASHKVHFLYKPPTSGLKYLKQL